MPDTRGAIVWAADSATLFYVRLDDNQRPLSVYRHRVGTPASEDVLVYEEADIGFYVGVGQTQSATLHHHRRARPPDHRGLPDRCRPARPSAPRLVARARARPRVLAIEHADGDEPHHHHQLGRRRGLPHLQRAARQPRHGELARARSPHKPGRLILETRRLQAPPGAARARGRPAAHRRPPLRRRRRARRSPSTRRPTALGLSAGYEFDTTTIRFTYSSMTTPAQVYDYDMESRARTLRKTQEVPSGHDPADYVTRRLLAPARRRRDGAGLAALPQGRRRSTARRRCSSTATAPTASRSRRASRRRGCRWSIAASSSPSPTSAAARTRAIAGTPAASTRRSSTPSATSSPPASTWSRRASRGAAASSPTAARPAAC